MPPKKRPSSPFRKPEELDNSIAGKKARGSKAATSLARQIRRTKVPMTHEEVVEAFCVPIDPAEAERRAAFRDRLSGEVESVSLYYADLSRISELQRTFLIAYAAEGTIKSACLAARIGRRVVNEWLDDPIFREEFELAEEEATDDLEQHAIWRAKSLSDPLMALMLKARRPQKYMEKLSLQTPPDQKKTVWEIGDTRLEF